jgi:hypothetical protein
MLPKLGGSVFHQFFGRPSWLLCLLEQCCCGIASCEIAFPAGCGSHGYCLNA